MKKYKIPVNKVFVIAEIANVHEGSVSKLHELIEKTLRARPDAIKFQLFKAEELLVSNHTDYDLYKKLEIPDSEWVNIFRIVRKKGVKIFVDVFSIGRAKFAYKLNVDAFKIHSSDINNYELLGFLSETNRPILLSCSGCSINEIDMAVNLIKKNTKSQVILMHGFQGFPTKISQINLRRISTLKARYDLPVGFMDHVDGGSELAVYLPLVALGLGVNLIEKHITLDRNLKGEDYQSSLNPDEFAKMVKSLKKSHVALGNDSLDIVGDELQYRINMKKRLVANKNLKRNVAIKNSDISLKRIHYSTPETSRDSIIGQITSRAIKKEIAFHDKNVKLKKHKIVAAIACRVQSTRLYAKPLQLINDRTILEQLILQLKSSRSIDEIVLTISDNPGNDVFVEFARKNGLKFVRGDDENVLGRIIKAADHVDANIILRVTSEDPIKHWEAFDDAITQHLSTKVDFTFTKDLPEGSGFEIINLDCLKESQEKGTRRNRSELVTSYIYEHKNQFTIRPFVVDSKLRRPEIRLTVDYPEDLILIRKIMSKLPKETLFPHLKDVIKIIDANPELLRINSQYAEHPNRIWL